MKLETWNSIKLHLMLPDGFSCFLPWLIGMSLTCWQLFGRKIKRFCRSAYRPNANPNPNTAKHNLMLEVYIVYNYLCVTLYHRDVPASRAPAWCGTWDTVSMELRISSLQTVLGAALEIVPWFLHPELKSPFSASVRCNEHVSLPDDTLASLYCDMLHGAPLLY